MEENKKDRFDKVVDGIVNAGSKFAGKFTHDAPSKIVKDKRGADEVVSE